ncbi:A24 family peptidase [Vibrio sp. VPAP30]|uniref:A24 family peptidase n=1 Tax=Vibrio sp. VPAP30 TaxID=1647102 RepID=UPI0009E63E11|nr:prepilin peptidase [Vibrio sp. VPAP30]
MLLATLTFLSIWSDIRYRRISNLLCLGVLLSCSIIVLKLGGVFQIVNVILFLSIGLVMSHLGWLGGGDSKLFAAYSVAIIPAYIPITLFIVAITGGITSVFYLFRNKVAESKFTGIPYGIAISLGGLFGVLASILENSV